MTIGISKEDLLWLNPWLYDDQQELLNDILKRCAELDPWLPIDKNTPIDRVIWLFANGDKYLGNWEFGGVGDGIGYWSAIPFNTKIKPTHWRELPADPKE